MHLQRLTDTNANRLHRRDWAASQVARAGKNGLPGVKECNGDITTTNRTQRRPHSAIIIAHITHSHSIYALCHSRGSELLTYFMNDFLPNLVFKEFWTHRWQFGMQPSRVTIPLLRWE